MSVSPYDYRLCGWRVRSDLQLPELPAWSGADMPADIVIEEGRVPDQLDPRAQEAAWLSVGDDGAVLLQIPDLVRILVRDGRCIRVQRLRAQDQGWRLFLLGSALAYLCLQRGLFPLHAASLRIGGRTLAIAGHSGAGKSTLAAALVRRGHGLLSDDLTVLRGADGSGPIEVLPAFPRLKLWREAIDALQIPADGLSPVREGMEKYDLSPHVGFDPSAAALDGVLLLSEAPEPSLHRHGAAAALPQLHRYLSRPHAAQELGLRAAMFAQAAAISRTVPVWSLQRPRRFDALEATVDLIEANFGT